MERAAADEMVTAPLLTSVVRSWLVQGVTAPPPRISSVRVPSMTKSPCTSKQPGELPAEKSVEEPMLSCRLAPSPVWTEGMPATRLTSRAGAVPPLVESSWRLATPTTVCVCGRKTTGEKTSSCTGVACESMTPPSVVEVANHERTPPVGRRPRSARRSSTLALMMLQASSILLWKPTAVLRVSSATADPTSSWKETLDAQTRSSVLALVPSTVSPKMTVPLP
mmetsp:Transcript_10538/g.42994  ORF Transcript_10538/g.42994 Transcript_10538/m.42994 type:complete len:223 (-) Transcript_10538:969-1637(-)